MDVITELLLGNTSEIVNREIFNIKNRIEFFDLLATTAVVAIIVNLNIVLTQQGQY